MHAYNNPVAQGYDQLVYTENIAAVPIDAKCTLTVSYSDGTTVKYNQTIVAQWQFKIPTDAAIGPAAYSGECLRPGAGDGSWLGTSDTRTFEVVAP